MRLLCGLLLLATANPAFAKEWDFGTTIDSFSFRDWSVGCSDLNRGDSSGCHAIRDFAGNCVELNFHEAYVRLLRRCDLDKEYARKDLNLPLVGWNPPSKAITELMQKAGAKKLPDKKWLQDADFTAGLLWKISNGAKGEVRP